MCKVLLILGFLASALADPTPDAKEVSSSKNECITTCVDKLVKEVVYPHCQNECNEDSDKSKCVTECTEATLAGGSINRLCTEQCADGLYKKIKDWIAVGMDRVADADYWKFYFDGFKLQDKVLALKKVAVGLQQEIPAAGFNKPAGYLPIPVVSPELPSYPDLKLQTTEPILKVLNQLLERQEEILQKFEVPFVESVAAAPATVLKSDVVKPASVDIPEGTRIEIITVDSEVPLKPYVHSKDTYDSDKAPSVEFEVPAAILKMFS